MKGILKVSRGTDGEVVAEWRPESGGEASVECTRLGRGGKVRRIGPAGRTILLEGDDKTQRVLIWLQSANSNAQEVFNMV